MRRTWTIDELVGFHDAPTKLTYLSCSTGAFVTRGVTIGSSLLTNKTTMLGGLVTNLTETTILAGVSFSSGDLFLVTLPTPYTMEDEFGPLIEIECRVCGFSFPSKELIKGRCKDCVDAPQRS